MSLEQWEIYYRRGGLATGPAGRDGLYDMDVRQSWNAFFGNLPSPASLLDIGTGNGVLPMIAKAVAASRNAEWEIHGADLAQIDPPRFVAQGEQRLAGIRFHPGVASERLPFADASFDAVSGHYALEFSQVPQALAEIHRVLKPGGDAQFVVLSDDCALVRSARASLQEADLVLKQTRLYRRLHKLVTLEQTSPAATDRATQELVGAIRTLKQALPQARQAGGGRTLEVALDATQKLLQARREGNPHAVGREVDRAEKELKLGARRLADLVEHARTAEQMQQIEQQAAAAGFTLIECLPQFHTAQVPAGWQLLLHKP